MPPTHLPLSARPVSGRYLSLAEREEIAQHTELTILADVPVYFCDPHSPSQRGTNENTNGLLRQYFPKGTDLSLHAPDGLEVVAAALNGRPPQGPRLANARRGAGRTPHVSPDCRRCDGRLNAPPMHRAYA
jgi:hypothetical protein